MFSLRSALGGGLLLLIIGVSFAVSLHRGVSHTPVVVTYPDPGDLSDVEGLRVSQVFSVKVNGTAVFVYEALQRWSFFSFAFDNATVRVDVTVDADIRDWRVRPVAYGIRSEKNSKTFTFSFSEPQKVVLQINGPDGHKLLISAETPETGVPKEGDRGVLYFRRGVHRLGYKYTPPSTIHTIYLAGGAVVEGTLRIEGRRNLKIIGRGIFSMGEWPHAEQEGMNLHRNDGLLVDGITAVNSPGWQLSIGGSDWAVIRNVKLLATKEHRNTDGVQTWNQHHVRVEDFFIRAEDDSLAINHGTVNLTVRNGILWNGTNGASFMLGWGGGQDSRHILFENIDVLENGSCCAGVFASRWGGLRQATISNVTYRNIRIENALRASGAPTAMLDMVTGRSPWNLGVLGRVEGIRFENVSFPFGGGMIKGHDPENGYYGITFVNCSVEREPVRTFAQLQVLLINAFDVTAHFEPHVQPLARIERADESLGLLMRKPTRQPPRAA